MDPMNQLARLRSLRQRVEPDRSIKALIGQTRVTAQRTHRRLGRLIDAWHDVVPAPLADATAVVGFRGGVAEVVVPSASVLYEVDRFLRSGGLDELRAHGGGPLVRVRLRLDEAATGREDEPV